MSETMVDVGAGAIGGGAITGAVFWWIINGLKAEIHELRGELKAVVAMASEISTKAGVLETRVDRTEGDVRDLRHIVKDGFDKIERTHAESAEKQTRLLTQIAQSLKGLDG